MTKTYFLSFLLLVISLLTLGQGGTSVVVRVKAKDAKFIGSSMKGAKVVISDATTGIVLKEGVTLGSTGNTSIIMKEPIERGKSIYDSTSATFSTSLDIVKPTKVKITATGPLSHPQSMLSASTEVWVIPQKHMNTDGVLLELSGYTIQLKPSSKVSQIGEPVSLEANVVMMCGCPITEGGLWNSQDVQVELLVYLDNKLLDSKQMHFKSKNTFMGTYTPPIKGTYDLVLTAYDPTTNNTGVDRQSIIVN